MDDDPAFPFARAALRLVAFDGERETHSTTGFVIDAPEASAEVGPLRITGRSAWTGATTELRITVRQLTEDGAEPRPLVIQLPKGYVGWVNHPLPNRDLAVMPVGTLADRVLAPNGRIPLWDAVPWRLVAQPSDFDEIGAEIEVVAAAPAGVIVAQHQATWLSTADPVPDVFLIDKPLPGWYVGGPILVAARDGSRRLVGVASAGTATQKNGSAQGVGLGLRELDALLVTAADQWRSRPP